MDVDEADIDSEVHEPLVYRFCLVVFGLNASPFLLNATLSHHILKYLQSDPKFVPKVFESFYVEDLMEIAQSRRHLNCMIIVRLEWQVGDLD